MARLYNGLNALAIGKAINDTHDRLHLNRVPAIQMLADGIGQLGSGIYEQMLDDKRGDEALQALNSVKKNYLAENSDGMSLDDFDKETDRIMEENRKMRGSMSGADFAKYVAGYTDRQDSRKESMDDWKKQYGITRADSAADRMFGMLSELKKAEAMMAEEDIPTQATIQRRKQLQENLEEFLKEHPEYGKYAELFSDGSAIDDDWTLEEIGKRFNGLKKKGYRIIKEKDDNGKMADKEVEVDLTNPEEMKSFMDEMQSRGLWSKWLKRGDNEALWNNAVRLMEGDPKIREAYFVGEGSTKTQGDAIKGHNDDVYEKDYASRVASFKNALKAKRGTAKFPSFTATEIARLKRENPKLAMEIEDHYGKGKK